MSKSILDHIKNGTFRPSRHAGKGVKKHLNSVPEPPEDLPEMAKEIWRAEAKHLFEATTISAKDLPALQELVMPVSYTTSPSPRDRTRSRMPSSA